MSATSKRKNLRGAAAPKPEDHFPEPPPEPDETDATEGEAEEESPVTVKPDGTVVVRLTQPLKPHEGKAIDPLKDLVELSIRPMYAGDLMALDKADGAIDQVVKLAKQLCGVPELAIRRLHADDFARVHGVVHSRLGKFLGTSRVLSALSLG